jgi:hypothetical protein
MNEQKHFSWQDGLPTAPDVQALTEMWPDLKIGDRIEYADVAALLSIPIGGRRWESITDQWRRRMRDKHLVIECEPGVAFYVATAEQILAQSYGTLKAIGRKAGSQRKKLGLARPENEAQRAAIEHGGIVMQSMEREAKKQRLNLLPPTAVKEQPRIQPPKSVG